jgi:hypothetical protein
MLSLYPLVPLEKRLPINLAYASLLQETGISANCSRKRVPGKLGGISEADHREADASD